MPMTREIARRIVDKLRESKVSGDFYVSVPPELTRALISCSGLGTWEMWRQLYNTGMRGAELARAANLGGHRLYGPAHNSEAA